MSNNYHQFVESLYYQRHETDQVTAYIITAYLSTSLLTHFVTPTTNAAIAYDNERTISRPWFLCSDFPLPVTHIDIFIDVVSVVIE